MIRCTPVVQAAEQCNSSGTISGSSLSAVTWIRATVTGSPKRRGPALPGFQPEHAAAHLDRRLVRVPEYYCRVAGADGSRVSSARDMTPISIRASPGNSRGMQERAQGPGWTYSRSPCIEQTGNYAQLER